VTSAEFQKILRISPFLILLVAGLVGLWNLSFVQYEREILKLGAAYRFAPGGLPLVQVICPKRAYEFETVHLTVFVTGLPKGSKSLTCTVETSENIEVQGSRQREVVGKEDWFLIPKEQGEYVVVVRGLAAAKGLPFEQLLSVFKIDHIPRRWYVFLVAMAGLLGVIGTLKKLWSKGKTPSEQ
jgi:hypothetical protein